jgi:hypothetical protein
MKGFLSKAANLVVSRAALSTERLRTPWFNTDLIRRGSRMLTTRLVTTLQRQVRPEQLPATTPTNHTIITPLAMVCFQALLATSRTRCCCSC